MKFWWMEYRNVTLHKEHLRWNHSGLESGDTAAISFCKILDII